MNELFIFGDNDKFKDFILFLLGKLPESTKESVLFNCIIITINNNLDGFYIPSAITKGKSIITLNYTLFEKDTHRFIKTLYHEIAHHWLSHKILFGENDELEQKQENEANSLVNEWFSKAIKSKKLIS